MNKGQPIQRVAVLGAGVMGTQIAALLANAGIDVDLLDMPDADDPAALARSGIQGALKSRPPVFFLAAMAGRITPGSLDDLDKIAVADWVVEAIVEDLARFQLDYSREQIVVCPGPKDAIFKAALALLNPSAKRHRLVMLAPGYESFENIPMLLTGKPPILLETDAQCGRGGF